MQSHDSEYRESGAGWATKPTTTPKKLSRFHATPAEINAFLLQHLAEDTLLRYQQALGNRAVSEAAKDVRVDTNLRQLEGNLDDTEYGRELADQIDPLKGGGHYPSELIAWPATETR